MQGDTPRVGDRVSTPTGEWQVRELILLGRSPVHYAVRVSHTDPSGIAYTVLMTAGEYRALLAKARPPAAVSPVRRR